METNDYKGFWRFIKFLHENGFLNHVIVIGSWAEHIYQQAGLLKDFKTTLRTLDIDFLVKNKMIPKEKMNLPKEARENGFLVQQDCLTKNSKVYMLEENLEIEFLIDQKGKGIDPVMETNLGVHAQALRNMSILSENTVKVNVFGYDITIPIPEAYIIHKMIINKDRKNKAEKDKESIKNLFCYINQDKFLELFNELGSRSKKKVDDYMNENLNNNMF